MNKPFQTAAASKVLSLEDLATVIDQARKQGATVVQCHGVFDLMHPGHVKHLENAKRQGNCLVITVTPDRYVNKGPGRPVFNERLRAESLAALASVDYVAINEWPTAVEAIELLRPDFYAKGIEYADADKDETGKIKDELRAVKSVGGKVHYTDDQVFSSSDLINKHFRQFPRSTEEWLDQFRHAYRADDILNFLESARSLKPVVLGEPIIDEYVTCEGLGKSSKDPILSFRYLSSESFAGGSLAVANHLAGICDEVALIGVLGADDSRREFAEASLAANVDAEFMLQPGAPTIRKRRFVDVHTGAKVMEIYFMDDAPLAPEVAVGLGEALTRHLASADIAVVTDYGHGMVSRETIDQLVRQSKYLVVNTQANAGNRGLHTISKFPKADYVCLNGLEVELDARHREMPFRDQLEMVAGHVDCPKFMVTLGRQGTLHYDRESGFVEAPALATRVVDRVGAGDAVLAVTGLLSAANVPVDVIGFIANVVGAQMVDALGNKIMVDRTWLDRHVKALLK